MIRVEISQGVLHPAKHEILIGEKIVNALKSAGVPVQGVFTIRNVDKGQLLYEPHGENGTHVYRWKEDDDDTAKEYHRISTVDGVSVYKSGKHYEDDDAL